MVALRFALLLSVLVSSTPGGADILMLDMNNSRSEYLAAKRAAEARGEKLVRIPPITRELEKDFQTASDHIWTSILTRREACAVPEKDSAACTRAEEGITAARKEYSSLAATVPKIDKQMLGETLAQFKASGTKLTSLVISGHDGDRDFGGIWGRDLTESDIEKAFKDHEPVGDDVRSLLLWGCYAATTADFRDSWKGAFPSLNIMAGFDAMGPAGDRPSNGRYLADLLQKEQRLSEAKTTKDLQKIANTLEGVNNLFASICVNRELIAQRRDGKLKAFTMNDAMAECAEPDEAERELAKQFQCYLNAEEGCKNPPPNPHTNVLRKYYEVLQKNRHCKDLMEEKGVHRPHYAQARRLIFDNTVRSSFNRLHLKEMADFNRLLDRLGVPKKLRIDKLGWMPRADYLALMRGLKKRFDDLTAKTSDREGHPRDARVIAMGMYLNQIHKIEDSNCVPLSWIEGHSPEEGRCGTKAAMATITSRAAAEARARP